MDITSYLLGKKASGGGGEGAEDYFGSTTNQPNFSYLIKKLPKAETTSTMITGVSGSASLVEIEELSIPNVTTLSNAFNSCSNLEKVKLITSSALTNINNAFYGCSKLNEISLFNTENVTTMEGCFRNCESLVTIPQYNTKKVSTFKRFAYGCSNLENFPQLDFSSATDLSEMFVDCRKLTDTSLNNILLSCISATSYTGTKTLTHLSIYSYMYPVSRIQALPNYQDFLNAGWTTGY